MAKVLRIPLQELLELGVGEEGVHRHERPVVVEEEPARLFRDPQDLGGAQGLAEDQSSEEGLGVDVGDALVVAEEVVLGFQVVLLPLGRALEIDLEPVVAVRVWRRVDEVAHAEHQMRRRVDHAVHEVDVPALVVVPDRFEVAVDRLVVFVPHVDELLGWDQPKDEPRQNSHGPEGAVHHLEDQRVLVVGRAGQHISLGGDDLVLEAGVVKATVDVGHRLDRAARDRPADGDGLQLRDHDRHEPQRKGLIDELVERHPRLGDADASLRVDLDHLVEVVEVDLVVGVLLVVDLRHHVGDDPLPTGERRRALSVAELVGNSRDLFGVLHVVTSALMGAWFDGFCAGLIGHGSPLRVRG